MKINQPATLEQPNPSSIQREKMPRKVNTLQAAILGSTLSLLSGGCSTANYSLQQDQMGYQMAAKCPDNEYPYQYALNEHYFAQGPIRSRELQSALLLRSREEKSLFYQQYGPISTACQLANELQLGTNEDMGKVYQILCQNASAIATGRENFRRTPRAMNIQNLGHLAFDNQPERHSQPANIDFHTTMQQLTPQALEKIYLLYQIDQSFKSRNNRTPRYQATHNFLDLFCEDPSYDCNTLSLYTITMLSALGIEDYAICEGKRSSDNAHHMWIEIPLTKYDGSQIIVRYDQGFRFIGERDQAEKNAHYSRMFDELYNRYFDPIQRIYKCFTDGGEFDVRVSKTQISTNTSIPTAAFFIDLVDLQLVHDEEQRGQICLFFPLLLRDLDRARYYYNTQLTGNNRQEFRRMYQNIYPAFAATVE